MTKDQCYQLGKITKPFGFKGQVVFFLDVDDPLSYAELDSAFVEIKGNLVPHFFQIININGNKAVVQFDDLTPQEATSLVGCDLYLPLSLLPKLTGNQFYFHEVVGFHVVDKTHGDIGTIRTVIDYPAQPLFQIFKNDTEILIPVIDSVIDKVDRENRTIYISAPNGLIELYLGQ
ncbi:MAG: 16S rRNA processing protein RimM [Bacteroidales bacterium]|nr:16S rRNA processing protein RimM [Bacteroidales bacterium]